MFYDSGLSLCLAKNKSMEKEFIRRRVSFEGTQIANIDVPLNLALPVPQKR